NPLAKNCRKVVGILPVSNAVYGRGYSATARARKANPSTSANDESVSQSQLDRGLHCLNFGTCRPSAAASRRRIVRALTVNQLRMVQAKAAANATAASSQSVRESVCALAA